MFCKGFPGQTKCGGIRTRRRGRRSFHGPSLRLDQSTPEWLPPSSYSIDKDHHLTFLFSYYYAVHNMHIYFLFKRKNLHTRVPPFFVLFHEDHHLTFLSFLFYHIFSVQNNKDKKQNILPTHPTEAYISTSDIHFNVFSFSGYVSIK